MVCLELGPGLITGAGILQNSYSFRVSETMLGSAQKCERLFHDSMPAKALLLPPQVCPGRYCCEPGTQRSTRASRHKRVRKKLEAVFTFFWERLKVLSENNSFLD